MYNGCSSIYVKGRKIKKLETKYNEKNENESICIKLMLKCRYIHI